MNRDERRGIIRLVRELGAEVLVSVPDHVPLSKQQRALRRTSIEEQVATCELCELRAGCNQPVVPRWPGITGKAHVTVVGESPTVDDDRKSLAFSGRVGRLMRDGLTTAGISAEDCAYMYVTACRAHLEDMPRPPSVREMAHCRDNLLQSISAADSKYLLLMGASAVRAWRSDVRLGDVAGRLFIWRGRFVWPMFSVQAVIRGTFPVRDWRTQLAQFGQIVADDAGVDALYPSCIECGESVYGYDIDGLPWCAEHLASHVASATTQDAGWAKHQVNQQTLGL